MAAKKTAGDESEEKTIQNQENIEKHEQNVPQTNCDWRSLERRDMRRREFLTVKVEFKSEPVKIWLGNLVAKQIFGITGDWNLQGFPCT